MLPVSTTGLQSTGSDPAREFQAMATDDRPRNPGQLERPSFLLCAPFSYATRVPNNVWMEEIDSDQREPDHRRAMGQFVDVYRYLASEALVYVLPTPADTDLQDLVFTANLGVVLEHVSQKDTVVISNFTSEPRRGETAVGVRFFEQMGYRVHVSPEKFEGEAELKHLHDNVYVGGYGIRSERMTYEWMERTFEMKVVPLCETDPYLYHLDCTVFPLTREDTVFCTELYEKEEIGQLERHTNIIDVGADECYSGLCNSVRLGNVILNASHIHELKAGTDEYKEELRKNRALEDIAVDHAFDIAYFNLTEYHKGGAMLSCMAMHLNRHSYAFQLV
jgi:N-dimethylarginine dimethylaminohydrolase